MLADVEGVTVRLASGADPPEALALLDRAEAAAGVPLVDESERRRLEAAVRGRTGGENNWEALLATHAGRTVGYAGLVRPRGGHPDASGTAVGDVVPTGDVVARGVVLRALLHGVAALAAHHGATAIHAWVRSASDEDERAAEQVGHRVGRRLAVLSRDLDSSVPPPSPPDEVRVRAFREADADAVVGVLRAAYGQGPDGGWDRERFDERRRADWFRPEDLLVAEVDGTLLGIHWTKRRSPEVGEVHNLAIAPEGQGRRLGTALLQAGLAHLRDVGCRRVLLWVDLANVRAVELYRREGFDTAWVDVLTERDLHA